MSRMEYCSVVTAVIFLLVAARLLHTCHAAVGISSYDMPLD